MAAYRALLFEDKLGITAGYESTWQQLLLKEGFGGVVVDRRSAYKALGDRIQLLIRKGNRVSPGFNPDYQTQRVIREWVEMQLSNVKPTVCICMDPSLLFLFNEDWDQATLDNMRGGHYEYLGVSFIISLGISAWHAKKSQKDIARLNDGYADKEEWEAEHGGDEQDTEGLGAIWMEPVSVPYGKFVLRADLGKANRVMRRAIMNIERERIENGGLQESH